jgi:fatty-acyl-CoA synthase
MNTLHHAHWPAGVPLHLSLPQTSLFYNVEVAATRFPDKPFIVFYDTPVTFAEFRDETERIAGFLQQECEVKAGDRVLLYMQNSPQWVLAYYGILRANAVVVPVNPMNLTDELRHYVEDSGATTAIVPQCLYPQIEPLLGEAPGQGLKYAIVATYSDYLKQPSPITPPEFVTAPKKSIERHDVTAWSTALERHLAPGPLTAGPDDLCVMPYTSGTTGKPKGCMHTHRSVMSTSVGGCVWFGGSQDSIHLSVLPMFHVTGMQGGMNGPLYACATIVILPRWDRDAAAQCVQRYRISSWTAIPTMIQDFFANPDIAKYDLSSISRLSGGGAAMPAAVAQRLLDLGVVYYEGYGLSETIGATHINPIGHAKKQCLGIPIYDVDSRVVDPVTLAELPPGEVGEIITHGPQVFVGYWNKPEENAQALVEIDGKRFFRTGDLGRVDEEGYFFMVDRLKRMINASGFKIWPTEVESLMYQHPAILEACVIGAKDAHRGETVKALIVPRPEWRARIGAQEIIDWCRENMAAYKCPRIIEFVDALPKSGAGKIMWRELQDREAAASNPQATPP